VELHDLDAPCPACGGTRQIQAPTVATTTAVPTPRILIAYNPDRPWYSQWRGVRQHLEIVEADCRPGAYRGNEPVKRDFENFFTRSQPNAITARIASVGFDDEETHVSIDWSQGLHGGTENALDLARRCVAAWDGYLKASGLQSPI
jgi:hypothetical protein